MAYIRSASCISIQPTFRKELIELTPANFPVTVIEPDYKTLISASLLRRMSSIVRYGAAAATDCLQQAGIETPSAIITGTGLGCLRDTQKFMDTFMRSESGTLPPTAFIQSTHNSLAGQIAMMTQCRGYNMTHVQNGVSFEQALQDALWLADEGTDPVLAGGADEKIPLLSDMARAWEIPSSEINLLSEGAAFFLISGNRENAVAQIAGISIETASKPDIPDAVNAFLGQYGFATNNIDCLLYANNNFGRSDATGNFWQGLKINYAEYCGYYATNSAFALFLAVNLIRGKVKLAGVDSGHFKNILILNNYIDQSLGLMLIQQP